jgi:hypothetical protein
MDSPEARATRGRISESARSRTVGAEYGISAKTVRDIWNRITWTAATEPLWTDQVHAAPIPSLSTCSYRPATPRQTCTPPCFSRRVPPSRCRQSALKRHLPPPSRQMRAAPAGGAAPHRGPSGRLRAQRRARRCDRRRRGARGGAGPFLRAGAPPPPAGPAARDARPPRVSGRRPGAPRRKPACRGVRCPVVSPLRARPRPRAARAGGRLQQAGGPAAGQLRRRSAADVRLLTRQWGLVSVCTISRTRAEPDWLRALCNAARAGAAARAGVRSSGRRRTRSPDKRAIGDQSAVR